MGAVSKKRKFKNPHAIVFFNNAEYTLKDLTDTINCANAEAQGYLEAKSRLQHENAQLQSRVQMLEWVLGQIKATMTAVG